MKQRSLESIIKEVLNDMNFDDDTYEAKIMMCHRKFNRLINRLGGDIDDMKDSSNKILFEENQVKVIKFILKQILSPNDNIIKKFSSSKDKDVSANEVEQFIQDVADEFCSNEESCNKELGNGGSCGEESSNETSSDKEAGDEESRDEESFDKDEVISYLSDIFMVSHVRIINECHELVDLFALNMQQFPRSMKLIYLEKLKELLSHLLVLQMVEGAINIVEISEQINLFNDDGKEVDSIYEGLPVNIQEEFIQRDQETLKALQKDEDLRAYVEKKTGRKVEEIFNYKALTDFSVILKKANIETDEQ